MGGGGFTLIHSYASLQRLFLNMCLDLLQIRIGLIRIRIPWMPIPDKIRQNFAEPNQSGTDPQHWKIP